MFNNTANGKDTMVQKNGQIKKQLYSYCGFNEYRYNCFSIIKGYVTATECNGLLENKLQTFFLTISIYFITV